MSMEQTLIGCMAGDNNVRQQADNCFRKSLDANPSETATNLIQVLCSSQNAQARGMAAILMRKYWTQKFATGVDGNLQGQIKKQLLQQLMKESKTNEKKVGDLIVEVSSKSPWPELLPFLNDALTTPSEKNESVLYVLGELVQLQHAQMSQQHIIQMIQLAGKSFGSPNPSVQLEAIKMFGKAVIYVQNAGDAFGDVAQNLYGILTKNLKNEEFAQQILQSLSEIAYECTTFFKKKLNETATLMQQIAVSQEIDDDTRQLALELLVTIVEREPSMIRKNKAFIEASINGSLQLMVSIEEDPDWNKEYDVNVEESANFDAGQVSLCRVGDEIAVSKFLPIIMPKIEQLLGMNDWKCKHAGLIAIAQTSDYLNKGSIDKNELVQKIASFMNDPHQRVRYAVVHCIGILCSDFGKKFVNKWHNQILGIFMQGMSDTPNPRVQAHSAVCIVNLAERVSSKLLRPNLEKLLQKLFEILNTNNHFVQENVLSAISEVAGNAQNEFVKYYQTFITPLINILSQPISEKHMSLRLEALRCVSYIGEAVDASLFKATAMKAIELSIPIIQVIQKAGFEVVRIFNSWRRIFRALGTDAAPFLPQVFEGIFKYASQDVLLMDNDSDDGHDGEDGEPVNASKVEEKVSAINLLEALAKYTSCAFIQYVERTASAMLQLITQPQENSIREAAADCLPSLVSCMFQNFKATNGHPDMNSIRSLMRMMVETEVGAMSGEYNVECVVDLAASLHKVFQIDTELTKFCMDEVALKAVTDVLLKCLKDSAERMDVRNSQMSEPNMDEEEVDKLTKENENEASLSSGISDAVAALITVYGGDYLPLLSPSMDAFQYMLGPDGLDVQKRAVLYIFCEVIESCPPQAYANLMVFLRSSLMNCSQVKDIDVRQAAIYGFGVMIEKIGEQVQNVNEIVNACFAQFTDSRFSDYDCDDVKDNAASTIGKALKHCPAQMNAAEIYPKWLNCFPIRNDDDCSKWCYKEFLRLIEAEQKDFLGADMANLPKIASFIADAAYTGMSDDKMDAQFTQLMQKVKNSPMAAKVFEAIPADLQQKIASQ